MSENIHIKRFMDGKMTPAEMHVKYAWGGRRCDACKTGVAALRCITFAPFKDMNDKCPELLISLARDDGKVPIVKMKDGDFVRIAQSYACANCSKDLQRAASRGPSWVLHEFQAPPKMDPVVQVSRKTPGV